MEIKTDKRKQMKQGESKIKALLIQSERYEQFIFEMKKVNSMKMKKFEYKKESLQI